MLLDRYFGVLTRRGGACGQVRKGALLWLVTVFDFLHYNWYLFRNRICSTVPGLSRFLFLQSTSLAIEKTLSRMAQRKQVYIECHGPIHINWSTHVCFVPKNVLDLQSVGYWARWGSAEPLLWHLLLQSCNSHRYCCFFLFVRVFELLHKMQLTSFTNTSFRWLQVHCNGPDVFAKTDICCFGGPWQSTYSNCLGMRMCSKNMLHKYMKETTTVWKIG